MPDDNTPVSNTDIETSVLITCAWCSEEHVSKCRKCNRTFCIIHSNVFSPNFCKECFANLISVEDKFTTVREDYDTKNDKLIIEKKTNSRYYMDGFDWPFVGLWIKSLDDSQLKALWLFHHFVMKSVEAENDVRKIKHYQKLREHPVPKLITQVKKTSSGERKITKSPDTPEMVRAKLKKQGLPDTIIEQMIKAMGV